jgi:hypothetical protein
MKRNRNSTTRLTITKSSVAVWAWNFFGDFEGMNRVLAFPFASQLIVDDYRRHALSRFPYAIVYRIDDSVNEIIVACLFHLRRKPGGWRGRE